MGGNQLKFVPGDPKKVISISSPSQTSAKGGSTYMTTEDTVLTSTTTSVLQPLLSIPVQVYCIVPLGEEITVEPIFVFNQIFGDHK